MAVMPSTGSMLGPVEQSASGSSLAATHAIKAKIGDATYASP
jgi:hypothetical protein